jgi:hypothetical protein
MCFLLAVWVWLREGGDLFVQLRPFHCVVRRGGVLVHGTNKKGGAWWVERRSWAAYAVWLKQPLQWRTRLVRLTPVRRMP